MPKLKTSCSLHRIKIALLTMTYSRPFLIFVGLSILAVGWAEELLGAVKKEQGENEQEPPYVPEGEGSHNSTDGKPNGPREIIMTVLQGSPGLVAAKPLRPGQQPVDAARLVGGTAMEGRLELAHRTDYAYVWGTVCDDFFNNIDATVACRMIGYRNGGVSLLNAYGSGTGQIWLDDVICAGSEPTLAQCSHLSYGTHNCVHAEDISIRCFQNDYFPDAARLVGGSTAHEGRLELSHNRVWGTVCDDSFDDRDAAVACRMMGYNGGTFISNTYGAGIGKIWLDDLNCNGRESALQNCRSPGWGVHDCGHNEDVSIRCR